MPLGTRDDRAVGRGLVPLGPLALILVLPCVAGGANELPRTSVDTVFGAWSAIGVAVVVGIGIVLGAMGVLVARWSRARLLGAPAEVAAILVAIALGCGVLVTSRSLGTGRSLGSRSLPPHSLAWAEREDALRLVELARYAGKPVIVDSPPIGARG